MIEVTLVVLITGSLIEYLQRDTDRDKDLIHIVSFDPQKIL